MLSDQEELDFEGVDSTPDVNSEEDLLANLLNQDEDISHAQDSHVPISLSPKGSSGTQEPPSAQSLGLDCVCCKYISDGFL